jgi:aspartyl-tRNA synthetase
MILAGEESIREVIPFPKTTSALCLLTNSPSEVSDRQLAELGLKLK